MAKTYVKRSHQFLHENKKCSYSFGTEYIYVLFFNYYNTLGHNDLVFK